MSEEVKTEQQVNKTEVVFREKKTEKVKNWVKTHKKHLIAGGIAAAGTVAGVIGFKHFGKGKTPDFTSWTDDSGNDHVSWMEGSDNVEVITTPGGDE